MNDIPDWAGKRACELLNAEAGYEGCEWPPRLYVASIYTVAKLVMQHEQPPVDPDEEAVKRIFKRTFNNPDYFMDGEHLARAVSQYKQEKGNG